MTSKFGAGAYGQTLYSAGSPFDISGTMIVDVGFAATLTNAIAFSGTMPIVVAMPSDRLNGDFLLSGELDFTVGFIPAGLFAGPLWGQDAICTGAWGPDALCDDPGWSADPDVSQSPPWAPSELCDG